uniref:Uncharacterized protein n=1 Tax=Amphimedon queenslandica TaxID=400682 RepID=A0A1X7UPH2_AMPQE
MATDPKEDISLYLIPPDTPVNKLDCTEAFKGLTDKEKLYAHHFGRACWEGGLICLLQTSPESPGIFLLLGELFRGQSLEALKELANGCGLSEDEYKSFLAYSAAFYSNFGNYKSFGDTKFIPDLPREKLEKLITSSQCYCDNKERISFLWSSVADGMFSLHPPTVRQLAFPPDGITTYYSGNCGKEDAEIIKEFMLNKDLSPYNTRLFKNEDGTYELRLASSLTNDTPPSPNDKCHHYLDSISSLPLEPALLSPLRYQEETIIH